MTKDGSEHELEPIKVPRTASFDGLAQANSSFHIRQFERRRDGLLSELRYVTGLPELARSLTPGELYRLVLPEGRVLQHGKDGLLRGVFYGSGGRIDEHAKFARIRPDLLKAATAIGGQILLISVAMQLNRIEATLKELSAELHRDRLAEIFAGVKQFETAMLMQDNTLRANAIQGSMSTLYVGLEKTILELGVLIAKAPDTSSRFLDHAVPWNNKVETATTAMRTAEESFHAALLGIRTLAECYAELGEDLAATKSLGDYLERVHQCGINVAAEKARLVPYSGETAPQAPWESFLLAYPEIISSLGVLSKADGDSSGSIIHIEFMPHELHGESDGDLSQV